LRIEEADHAAKQIATENGVIIKDDGVPTPRGPQGNVVVLRVASDSAHPMNHHRRVRPGNVCESVRIVVMRNDVNFVSD